MNSDQGHGFSPQEVRMFSHLFHDSLLAMTRVMFKRRDRARFIVSPHHQIVADTLDRVIQGDIKRLIINIPPGYTKTELAVIFFILKGLMVNPQAKFLHTSYSGDLALLNSGTIKDMIHDPLFQAIQPMKLKYDTKAKSRWYTEQGGGMMAAPSRGQITGFRAGRMDKSKFTGALIVDDPIKPAEALSPSIREAVNRDFNLTVKSRLATEDIPIIIIMQRVHEHDLTGFLLEGGSNEMWDHLVIPAEVPAIQPEYKKTWKCGRPIHWELPPGPLWPFKHSQEELDQLKKANSFVWASQYKNDPDGVDIQMFRREWFPRFQEYDPANGWVTVDGQTIRLVYKMSFSDTAMKVKEANDFSVFQTWGKGSDGRLYLLDQVRGKWEAPDLEAKFRKYLKRLKFTHGVNNMAPRGIYVEDKSSGTGLIQSLNRKIGTVWKDEHGKTHDLTTLPKITGIPRSQDKVSRAFSAAPEIQKGLVVLPEWAFWVEDFLTEVTKFNAAMTHTHDDQVDPLLDAVHNMLITDTMVSYDDVVGM